MSIKEYLYSKNEGWIDNWIAVLISIFIMFVAFIFIIEYLKPITMYIKLNQDVRKYTLLMEKDGGLSPLELDNLKSDLSTQGFNSSDITVIPTMQPVDFGDDVTLEIDYNYRKQAMNVDGIKITRSEVIIPMAVKKSTTSKKGT